MRGYLAGFLIAGAAFGQQTVSRTYAFTHLGSVTEFREIVNLMRTAASIKDTSANDPQETLTVSGTAEQIGVTDWLFKELDQPPQGQPAAIQQYNVSADDILRVFYLPSSQSVTEFQETINGVRTVGEIRNAFGVNEQHALMIRATAAQVAQTAWILNYLEQPAHSAGTQYQLAADDVTQVFYLPNTATVQDFQEIANMVRTIAEIRRVVALNAPRALVARATPAQVAMAAWLVSEFQQAQTAPAAPSFSAGADDVVRVFYLSSNGTVQDFQAAANKIRTTAQIRRAIAVNTPRAFTVRGTAGQIAQAAQMVQELSAPAGR